MIVLTLSRNLCCSSSQSRQPSQRAFKKPSNDKAKVFCIAESLPAACWVLISCTHQKTFHQDRMFARYETQFKAFKHIHKNITIDEFNWRYTVASGFFFGLKRKRSCSDDDSFVTTPHHCAAKIAHLGGSYCSLKSFALKKDVETYEGIYLQCPDPIYPAISRSSSNGNVLEARLAQ